MNWAHVILAGYIGAVIAVIVGVFRKNGWVGKAAGAVIFVVAIIGWNLFDVHYLIPRMSPDYGQTEEQKFESAMMAMPTFRVIKEQDPAFWQHILELSVQMKKAGKDQQQIIDAIQPQILQLQMARLQQAPDANVVEYMKINLEQIAQAQASGDDVCFRFLFPAVKGGINPVKVISHEVLARRTESDARMMRAAYGPNKHTVTPQENSRRWRICRLLARGWYSVTDRISTSCPIRTKVSAKRKWPVDWCRISGRRFWRCRKRMPRASFV